MRVYSMLDVSRFNRSLLDNIMPLGSHHAVEPLEVGAEQENGDPMKNKTEKLDDGPLRHGGGAVQRAGCC